MEDPSEPDNQQAAIGRVISRIIEAGRLDREKWLKQGDEIERYTTSDDYGFLYQDFDTDISFKARVNKASEYQQIYGAFLYPNNPDAAITSEAWASTWATKRHRIEEQYADYAAKHGNLAVHMRRCVDHALIYGRAPLWAGFNASKGIVQHVFDRSSHLLLDPDAKNFEEINWQSRERFKPRWELAKRYPESAAIIDKLPGYSDPSSKGKDKAPQGDRGSDIIQYYEVWMGVAASNYSASLETVTADGVPMQPKMKYCIADGKIIHAGDWEIPFFLMDEWPGTCLDLMEKPGCLWPTQPLEPGMGHLRAMNYAYTLFISKFRFMSRTPFARMTVNGQKIENEQLHKILRGEQIDILDVVVNGAEIGDVDINKLFQRIDWGDPVPGMERLWALLSTEFEKSTGLAEVLYAGQTKTQIRSAKAADIIESNSRMRSDAMRETVVQYLTKIFRKTLFAARYMHGSEDITKLFGPEAGKLWGELGSPEAVVQEEEMRAQIGEMMSQQMQMMGAPPEQIVASVEEQLGPPQFVSMDGWLHEADRMVDAGSMRRMDADAQMQAVSVMLNQVGPSVVNIPGGAAFIGMLAAEATKLSRLSPELLAAAENIATMAQQMAMMPPLPPGPSPEKPPQAGPTGGTPQGV